MVLIKLRPNFRGKHGQFTYITNNNVYNVIMFDAEKMKKIKTLFKN